MNLCYPMNNTDFKLGIQLNKFSNLLLYLWKLLLTKVCIWFSLWNSICTTEDVNLTIITKVYNLNYDKTPVFVFLSSKLILLTLS